MYEYQIKLNGQSVNYVIYNQSKPLKDIKQELVSEGWSNKIVVKLFRRF